MDTLPVSAGPTRASNCPFARTGPLRTKSRCEVPMRFTPGWHSGDAGVCLWAVHGATELRVFTIVAFCAPRMAMGLLCATAEINTSVPAALQRLTPFIMIC